MTDFDLFVIGAGSGGVRAARISTQFGAKVAVAEDQYMGGTCVNVGCVPKKLYSYASHYAYDFQDSEGFGWSPQNPEFHWETLRDHKKSEITRLNGIYENILEAADVTLIEGRAKIVGPNTVEVSGQQYQCKRILIATGGWPFVPDIPGKELAVTSNEIFDLETFPKRILIVGGGYIAVEFAGIFAGLGSNVTLSYRGAEPLKNFDADIRRFFLNEMKKHVNLELNSNIEKIERNADGSLKVSFQEAESLQVDCVLYATGRKPNLTDLGLENTSVTLSRRGAIEINDRFQTNEPSIYALGDVVGKMELTPVALEEGMTLARNLFNGASDTMDYDLIPTAVFSHPNIGTVGLSEEMARLQCDDVVIYQSEFKHLKHTISGRDARTMMKIVVDGKSDKVLGLHMVGDDAGEIIQGFAVALKCGVTKAQLDSTVGIHPTAAEEFVTMRSPRAEK